MSEVETWASLSESVVMKRMEIWCCDTKIVQESSSISIKFTMFLRWTFLLTNPLGVQKAGGVEFTKKKTLLSMFAPLGCLSILRATLHDVR